VYAAKPTVTHHNKLVTRPDIGGHSRNYFVYI